MNPVKESAKDGKTLAKISVFENAEFGSVRTAVIDGEPFFVGKDVASILGYKDTADAVKVHVDEDDKGVGNLPTPGGKQKAVLINESGLYSLILSSKLPAARKFKRWITSEVLKALKEYQVKKAVPNAVKDKGTSMVENEKPMTTRELAETLGVDVKTIQRAVDSLDIDVERVGSSHTMVFNEAQATAIKIKLQNHSKVARNCFDTFAISNDLEISMPNQKWYTIEDLASLCGFADSHTMQSNPNILELLNQFSNSNDVKKGGYHNLRYFYSENVLKTLKQYQLGNYASNAIKDKAAALEGNISFVQQETVKQTITSLMDNPDTLQLLLTESLSRQQSLQIENKMMKDVIAEQKPKVEYVDSYCDATNLEEIGHLGKVTEVGEQKIFKRLLDDGYIKVRYSTEGVKSYDPCYGYEKYFEAIHVPFLRGDKKLSRDKLMLTHKGFMFFRAKYAPKEMIEETAVNWIEKEKKNGNDNVQEREIR